MKASIRQHVRARAGDRCEYCHLPQHAYDGVFQIEPIIARQHQGSEDPSNLALACDHCNLRKGPNLTAIDPLTDLLVRLFDPRSDGWHDHFDLVRAEIIGLTATGRATVRLLQMNTRTRVALRAHWIALGRW